MVGKLSGNIYIYINNTKFPTFVSYPPSVSFVLVFLDMTGAMIPVPHSGGSCGVKLGREKNQSLSFVSRYDSCYAQTEVKYLLLISCFIYESKVLPSQCFP